MNWMNILREVPLGVCLNWGTFVPLSPALFVNDVLFIFFFFNKYLFN